GGGEAVVAEMLDGVVVGHDDQGDCDVNLGQVGDDVGRGGPDLDGPARRLLDDAPVHYRVGERDADLDGVGAGVGHGPDHVEPGGAQPARHVRDQELAAGLPPGPEVRLEVHSRGSPRSSATWWASLSPRPDSVTSTVDPAGTDWP